MNYLNGKKTYLVATGFVLVGLGGFLSGEMSLQEAIFSVLSGLGWGALRAGVKKSGPTG